MPLVLAPVVVQPGIYFQLLQSDVCGCLQFDLTQGDDYKTLRDQIVFLEDYISDFDEDTQREVVATICNGIMNDGDHLQVVCCLFAHVFCYMFYVYLLPFRLLCPLVIRVFVSFRSCVD